MVVERLFNLKQYSDTSPYKLSDYSMLQTFVIKPNTNYKFIYPPLITMASLNLQKI